MTSAPTAAALFEYRLRHSKRARNVCLRVTIDRGLEVVVPAGFNPAGIPRLIEQKQSWIRGALERVERKRRLLGVDQPWALPTSIELHALGQAWQVAAQWTEQTRLTLRETSAHHLLLRGRIDDEAQSRRALLRWLTGQAQAQLAPMLYELSDTTGLGFARLGFRQQRSRWGSCSPTRAISLNVNLLFLPPVLARYVMVHELCHVVHLNHSARFWALVEKHHPGARADDRALRDGWKSVPRWARHV